MDLGGSGLEGDDLALVELCLCEDEGEVTAGSFGSLQLGCGLLAVVVASLSVGELCSLGQGGR